MIRRAMNTVSLGAGLLLALTIAAVPATAQEDGDECTGEQRHEFDFWVGRWNVEGPGGKTAGTSEIVSVAGGCAFLETWTGARGDTGRSLNFLDAADGRWHQLWVGSDGTVLRLVGGPNGKGAMVMVGERKMPDGNTVLDRITWTPMPDGALDQHWEQTHLRIEGWRTLFRATYRPRPGDA